MTARPFRGAWMTARRNELGCSQAAMADHLGVPVSTLRVIEGGDDASTYTLDLVLRLADGLGCSIDDLWEHGTTAPPADDVALIVAAVVTAGGRVNVDVLAEALDWSSERCIDTLHAAERTLAEVGMTLVWAGTVSVALAVAVDVDVPSGAIASRSIEWYGFNVDQGRIVAKLARKGRLTRTDHPTAAGALRDAGFIEATGAHRVDNHASHGIRTGVQLTAEAKFNLCL